MVVRKQSRGDVTREALMRAAEKLIASKGLENITIREIVDAAGQKNESALQYHFQNLTGLVRAIHAARDKQIHAMRAIEIEKLSRKTVEPTLRDVCKLMVEPAFLLAKSKPDFRQYVKAFGHELALTDQSVLKVVRRRGGDTDIEINRLLRSVLPELNAAAFDRRLESAVRFVASSMYHEARQPNAFKGDRAELFFSSLIDSLGGLLGAPESAETRAIG
jgi:AcrR family transcriptional regulator